MCQPEDEDKLWLITKSKNLYLYIDIDMCMYMYDVCIFIYQCGSSVLSVYRHWTATQTSPSTLKYNNKYSKLQCITIADNTTRPLNVSDTTVSCSIPSLVFLDNKHIFYEGTECLHCSYLIQEVTPN